MRGQGDLVPIVGFGAGGRQHPGVVNKQVQRRHSAGQVGGEGADRAQVRHITHLHLHVGIRVGRDDLLPCPLTALPIAHSQQNGRAQPGQSRGDRLADAAIRAGDKRGPTFQRARLRIVCPAQLPEPIADAAVAGDHSPVEGGVEKRTHPAENTHAQQCSPNSESTSTGFRR